MTTFAHDYTEQILHRGRVYMDPVDFVPNWSDKPRKQKFYPDADRLPLGTAPYPGDASVDAGLHGAETHRLGHDLDTLGALLQDSYGLSGRRLGIQANTDLGGLPWYVNANWSRGTASGGGLYPVAVYLVAGPSSDLVPGVYHYSPSHHALQRLLVGDVSGDVRAALGGRCDDTDTFLVLGIKYWQNAFKYNSFSFHAVTMDVGTVLGTWRLWSRARGAAVEPHLWFDEPALAHLLGVEPSLEGIHAVVPLGGPGAVTTAAPTGARVALRDHEKSRVSFGFEAVETMQAETQAGCLDVPTPTSLDAARPTFPAPDDGSLVALPPARPMPVDVRAALRRRRSSFGRFQGDPMPAEELGALLAAGQAGAVASEATPSGADARGITTLYAFVNHVEGVAPGAYRYHPAEHALEPVVAGGQGRFLQDNYFLSNYNMEQAGAVIVPTVRTHAVLDAVGSRGYRLVNATIGAVSQATYTAAAALDTGCGVALGFDNISFIELLGLEESGEKPLLVMAVGRERGSEGDFGSSLVPAEVPAHVEAGA
ncbi:SagB family peptide dehydrogenase [Nocardioides dongxiaopingii]|uniref:SagB family peptide dehydrogenase n=1 Tax=Nocardioides dongxiaopingii TaxID=2576036 RepID=UPI0010C76885|nr:SagB family peptide dehydrogenase [Nocardioides dongxiaopingii]